MENEKEKHDLNESNKLRDNMITDETFTEVCKSQLLLLKEVLEEDPDKTVKMASVIWGSRFQYEAPSINDLSSKCFHTPASHTVLEWCNKDDNGKKIESDYFLTITGLHKTIKESPAKIDQYIVHFINTLMVELAFGATDRGIDWEEVARIKCDLKTFLQYREMEKKMLLEVNPDLKYAFDMDNFKEYVGELFKQYDIEEME